MEVSIQPKYYRLKIEELHLAFEYAQKKQQEKEEQKEFLEEMISPKLYTMYVTPKEVDETVRYLSFTISEGLNMAFSDSLIEEDRS